MKRTIRLWVVLCALVALPACAGGSLFGRGATDDSGSAVQGYNFDYRIEDHGVGLVQAFDDGHDTYFQLRALDLENVPVLWSETSDGARRAVPLRASGPYLVASELERKFVLTLGQGKDAKEASAIMLDWGKRGLAAPEPLLKQAAPADQQAPRASSGQALAEREAPHAECHGPIQSGASKTIDVPFVRTATEPTAQARADLRSIATRLAGAGEILVRGRPSPGGGVAQARERAEAIRTLLVQSGVPESHIRIELAGTSKAGPVAGVYVSQIRYGAASSGFVVLDGC